MGARIDGSSPTTIRSVKRALVILEYEARKAGQRGDVYSETNLRAIVAFLAELAFSEIRPELREVDEAHHG